MPSPMVGSPGRERRRPRPELEPSALAYHSGHRDAVGSGYYSAFHSRGRRTHARTVISAHKLDSPATDSEPTFPCAAPARLGWALAHFLCFRPIYIFFSFFPIDGAGSETPAAADRSAGQVPAVRAGEGAGGAGQAERRR
jgi:hypothetical protein